MEFRVQGAEYWPGLTGHHNTLAGAVGATLGAPVKALRTQQWLMGLGFGVRSSGFGVRSSGFGVRGSEFGVRGSGFTITPDTTAPGMIDPILHWTPSIAPCGFAYVDSDKYPKWQHNMLVGALAGQHIHRVVFQDTTVVHTEIMLQDFARFRTIEQGPDGLIYVLTEGPGLFFRLVPE